MGHSQVRDHTIPSPSRLQALACTDCTDALHRRAMAASGSQGWCLSRVRARCFKSFGAAWEEVRLQPGLTGLTGPNGCGKSTLLQAILFAVGCSAAQLSAKSFQELKNTSHKDQVHGSHSRSSEAAAQGQSARLQ